MRASWRGHLPAGSSRVERAHAGVALACVRRRPLAAQRRWRCHSRAAHGGGDGGGPAAPSSAAPASADDPEPSGGGVENRAGAPVLLGLAASLAAAVAAPISPSAAVAAVIAGWLSHRRAAAGDAGGTQAAPADGCQNEEEGDGPRENSSGSSGPADVAARRRWDTLFSDSREALDESSSTLLEMIQQLSDLRRRSAGAVDVAGRSEPLGSGTSAAERAAEDPTRAGPAARVARQEWLLERALVNVQRLTTLMRERDARIVELEQQLAPGTVFGPQRHEAPLAADASQLRAGLEGTQAEAAAITRLRAELEAARQESAQSGARELAAKAEAGSQAGEATRLREELATRTAEAAEFQARSQAAQAEAAAQSKVALQLREELAARASEAEELRAQLAAAAEAEASLNAALAEAETAAQRTAWSLLQKEAALQGLQQSLAAAEGAARKQAEAQADLVKEKEGIISCLVDKLQAMGEAVRLATCERQAAETEARAARATAEAAVENAGELQARHTQQALAAQNAALAAAQLDATELEAAQQAMATALAAEERMRRAADGRASELEMALREGAAVTAQLRAELQQLRTLSHGGGGVSAERAGSPPGAAMCPGAAAACHPRGSLSIGSASEPPGFALLRAVTAQWAELLEAAVLPQQQAAKASSSAQQPAVRAAERGASVAQELQAGEAVAPGAAAGLAAEAANAGSAGDGVGPPDGDAHKSVLEFVMGEPGAVAARLTAQEEALRRLPACGAAAWADASRGGGPGVEELQTAFIRALQRIAALEAAVAREHTEAERLACGAAAREGELSHAHAQVQEELSAQLTEARVTVQSVSQERDAAHGQLRHAQDQLGAAQRGLEALARQLDEARTAAAADATRAMHYQLAEGERQRQALAREVREARAAAAAALAEAEARADALTRSGVEAAEAKLRAQAGEAAQLREVQFEARLAGLQDRLAATQTRTAPPDRKAPAPLTRASWRAALAKLSSWLDQASSSFDSSGGSAGSDSSGALSPPMLAQALQLVKQLADTADARDGELLRLGRGQQAAAADDDDNERRAEALAVASRLSALQRALAEARSALLDAENERDALAAAQLAKTPLFVSLPQLEVQQCSSGVDALGLAASLIQAFAVAAKLTAQLKDARSKVAKLMGLLAATEEAIATARAQAAVLRARVARHAGSRAALVALATLEELVDQAAQLRSTAASPHGAPARSAAAVDQSAAAGTPGLHLAGQPVWREALNSAVVASSRDEADRISRARDRMIGLLSGWDGPERSVASIQAAKQKTGQLLALLAVRQERLAQERGTLDMLGRLLSGGCGERNSSTPAWLTAALQAQQQTVAELRHGAASVCC